MAADYFVTTDGINLPSRTSDPAPPTEGSIWHRSDLNEIHQYLNGAVSQLAKSPSNTVVVNSLADLPTAVGGKITLAANTKYIIGASINIGTDYLEITSDCSIQGISGLLAQIIYSGAGGAIRVTDASVVISHLTIVATAGQVFTCSNAALTKIMVVQNTIFANCASIGSISGFELVNFNFNKFQSNTTGLSLTGVKSFIFIDNYTDSTNSGTFILFTGGTFDNIIISRNYMDVPLGSVGIDLPSAMITLNEFVSITTNILEGAGTLYQNFTPSDARFEVIGNIGIGNTIAKATMYWTGNVTTMASPGLNTWGKIIGGTSISANLSRFTHISPNRVTYTGIKPIDVNVQVALAAYYNTGGAFKAEIAIAKNGVVIAGTSNAFTIYGNPADEPNATHATISIIQNDYLEVFINDRTGGAGTFTITYLNVQIESI